MAEKRDEQGMDYEAEGTTPPREKDDPTNRGYDEAARSGPSRYGVREGEGGVFGTSGGGTYETGFQVEERPVIDEGRDDSGRSAGHRGEDGHHIGKASE